MGWRIIVMQVSTAIIWLIIGISIGWRYGKSNAAKQILELMEFLEKEKK